MEDKSLEFKDDHYFETNEEALEAGDGIAAGVDVLGNYNQPDYSNISNESLIQMRAQWTEELRQIEDEIQTLRQVLGSKFRRQHFLKRQLGITAFGELKDDIKQGIHTFRASDTYQRTSAAVKNVKDKTSAVINEKWNWIRQSNAYKSLGNKVGSAYSSVRSDSIYWLKDHNLTKSNPDISNLTVNNSESSSFSQNDPRNFQSDNFHNYDIDHEDLSIKKNSISAPSNKTDLGNNNLGDIDDHLNDVSMESQDKSKKNVNSSRRHRNKNLS